MSKVILNKKRENGNIHTQWLESSSEPDSSSSDIDLEELSKEQIIKRL